MLIYFKLSLISIGIKQKSNKLSIELKYLKGFIYDFLQYKQKYRDSNSNKLRGKKLQET